MQRVYPACNYITNISVAVLSHRLWDIDLIIRRTLVYSILTAILSLIYFSSVLVLQNMFTLTG
ncbi:MAG: hypothetical protein EHM70_07590 [Chloroflexota bacterium]|nr:MAG: hypothetical protein EHM70_07590 [Chloroflexota bacterium]